MRVRLWRRIEVWWPTKTGLFVFGCILAACIGFVAFSVEGFLAVTQTVPANVLVVEGWIKREALQAAVDEFKGGNYDYVVASGGWMLDDLGRKQWSFAEIAFQELEVAGVPEGRIVLAQSEPADKQRTFASALKVSEVLKNKGVSLRGMTVFTRGVHARRSWLVFRKTQKCPVGVVAWVPERERGRPWWQSSERAKDLLTECVGWSFEKFLNSGRKSNQAVAE